MAGRRRLDRRGSAGRGAHWLSVLIFCVAALAVIEFYQPPAGLFGASLEGTEQPLALPDARPSINAFGKSGEVRVRLALPGQLVEYPLEVAGDPSSLAYQWVRSADHLPVDSVRLLSGASVLAPQEPGFYQLSLMRDGQRVIVDELTVAVLVPFSQKLGATLNGYRIGTYLAERLGARKRERPAGFVEVTSINADMPITKHFKLSDFLTHDDQDTWPRYAAISPQLLDKLELVIAELARQRGDTGIVSVSVSVHSGFRTPSYNLSNRFAGDSRHQYGDAADVAIDANGDGRYTASDSRLVSLAVEAVERNYPELTGGLGLYAGQKNSSPYVHIDARGQRARWRG
jgi:uncharacterized protein YcbK (DUF882 family)